MHAGSQFRIVLPERKQETFFELEGKPHFPVLLSKKQCLNMAIKH